MTLILQDKKASSVHSVKRIRSECISVQLHQILHIVMLWHSQWGGGWFENVKSLSLSNLLVVIDTIFWLAHLVSYKNDNQKNWKEDELEVLIWASYLWCLWQWAMRMIVIRIWECDTFLNIYLTQFLWPKNYQKLFFLKNDKSEGEVQKGGFTTFFNTSL